MRLNQNFQFVEVENKQVYIQNKSDSTKKILMDSNNRTVERIASLLFPNCDLTMVELVSRFDETVDISAVKDAVSKLESIDVIDVD